MKKTMMILLLLVAGNVFAGQFTADEICDHLNSSKITSRQIPMFFDGKDDRSSNAKRSFEVFRVNGEKFLVDFFELSKINPINASVVVTSVMKTPISGDTIEYSYLKHQTYGTMLKQFFGIPTLVPQKKEKVEQKEDGTVVRTEETKFESSDYWRIYRLCQVAPCYDAGPNPAPREKGDWYLIHKGVDEQRVRDKALGADVFYFMYAGRPPAINCVN